MESKNLNCLQILNKFIDDGRPPDYITMDANNKGDTKLYYHWNCGTNLELKFEPCLYFVVLKRFLDFWGACFPHTKFKVQGETN